VLEQADVIGQPLQVTEWRVGAPQRTEAVAPGPRTERLRKNLNAHQRRT